MTDERDPFALIEASDDAVTDRRTAGWVPEEGAVSRRFRARQRLIAALDWYGTATNAETDALLARCPLTDPLTEGEYARLAVISLDQSGITFNDAAIILGKHTRPA